MRHIACFHQHTFSTTSPVSGLACVTKEFFFGKKPPCFLSVLICCCYYYILMLSYCKWTWYWDSDAESSGGLLHFPLHSKPTQAKPTLQFSAAKQGWGVLFSSINGLVGLTTKMRLVSCYHVTLKMTYLLHSFVRIWPYSCEFMLHNPALNPHPIYKLWVVIGSLLGGFILLLPYWLQASRLLAFSQTGVDICR